jgi:hypothetical protein
VSWRGLFGLWVLGAVYLFWWVSQNPLPDGFQNEYLLIGNALDLWGALTDKDLWHMRWYMYTGYWPWGLYALPWPLMAILGPGRLALVAGNLIHLMVLLVGVNAMGRAMGTRWAPALIMLCPGVFGTLVRFEPNLAAIAWTAAGLAFLIRSNGLKNRGDAIGWGVCLGLGLMMDRLNVAFFLIPPVLPMLWRAPRRVWRNLALGCAATLLLSGAYYREFFLRHSDELLGQVGSGEIDSAGVLTKPEGMAAFTYYPLVLLDSQAGPIVGVLMLWGLIGRMRGPRAVLMTTVFAGIGIFTLISKHQVFYTLPLLAPLSVLAASRGKWVAIGLLGGVWSLASVGLGVVPGGPWMPEAWVQPRHTLARPPSQEVWPLQTAIETLPPEVKHIAVLSESHALYEGFVVLAIREARPKTQVRGVVLDPHGSFEHAHEFDAFIWVGPMDQAWPTVDGIHAQLIEDHYDLNDIPPIARTLINQEDRFERVGTWPAGEQQVVTYVRP